MFGGDSGCSVTRHVAESPCESRKHERLVAALTNKVQVARSTDRGLIVAACRLADMAVCKCPSTHSVCYSTCEKTGKMRNKYNDNFANVLRQIEIETQEEQKRQFLLGKELRALAAQEPKKCENPLRYQLIPPRFLMKHTGYAVCRPCADHTRHRPTSSRNINFNLMDYSRENSPERATRNMSNGGFYFTVELGSCLARLTRLMLTAIKTLKELELISGDMYPLLGNDITYLNGLYLRMKSSYTHYRTLKMKSIEQDNSKEPPLSIGAVKIFNNPEDVNKEVHCSLAIPEDTANTNKGKRPFRGYVGKSSRSKSEDDFEQYRTRKRRFRFGSKWKRDE